MTTSTGTFTHLTNLTQLFQTVTWNNPSPDDCLEVVFSNMEYLPWHNPDNVISGEAESVIRQVKYNLLVLLFLIGGPANVINMAVFYQQGLRDRVNLCLFALALADEMTLVFPLVNHGEQLYIQFTTGEQFGPFSTALTNANMVFLVGFCFVSPVLSTIISIERCLCVFNPLKFQTLLRTKTMAVMIATVNVLILSLFFVVCYRYRVGCVHDPTTGITVTTAVEGDFYKLHKEFINRLDGFVFGVGLPTIEIVVVLIATILTVIKLRQIVAWRSETSTVISAHEVGLTKMLVGNSILFIIWNFPVAMVRFSWLVFPDMNSGGRHHNLFLSSVWISGLFSFCNATFNIFIYYAMGSRYRESFWALFGRNTKKA